MVILDRCGRTMFIILRTRLWKHKSMSTSNRACSVEFELDVLDLGTLLQVTGTEGRLMVISVGLGLRSRTARGPLTRKGTILRRLFR